MIVTGASSGIGRALSLAAARAGYRFSDQRAPRRPSRRGCANDSRSRRPLRSALPPTSPRLQRPQESSRRRCAPSDTSTSWSIMPAEAPTARCWSRATPQSRRSGSSRLPVRCVWRALPSRSSKQDAASWSSSEPAACACRYHTTAPISRPKRRCGLPRFNCAASCAHAESPSPTSIRDWSPANFTIAMGIERTASVRAASPEHVARAILRGIARRRAVVNAVPWQTAGAVLGEWFGTITDSVVISRFTPKRAAANERAREPAGPAPVQLEPAPATSDASFQRALEPVARRMERVKLPPDFLRSALVPNTRIELGDLAMRWAGMPNKNERAVLHEALDALATGGYLEPQEEGTWRVVRAAD